MRIADFLRRRGRGGKVRNLARLSSSPSFYDNVYHTRCCLAGQPQLLAIVNSDDGSISQQTPAKLELRSFSQHRLLLAPGDPLNLSHAPPILNLQPSAYDARWSHFAVCETNDLQPSLSETPSAFLSSSARGNRHWPDQGLCVICVCLHGLNQYSMLQSSLQRGYRRVSQLANSVFIILVSGFLCSVKRSG